VTSFPHDEKELNHMPGNAPNGVSQWWASQPMGVRLFFLLNVSVYLGGLVVPPSWPLSSRNAPRNLCMQSGLVAAHPDQSYRVFTSAFTHGGLMHIG
jgi:membrane associated rhomboid family serine protease